MFAWMKTRSHEYAGAITLSQCDLYTRGGGVRAKHMFSNKSAPFFFLLPLSETLIYLPGLVKSSPPLFMVTPSASRAGSDDSELRRLIMVIKQKVKPELYVLAEPLLLLCFMAVQTPRLTHARGEKGSLKFRPVMA